MEVSRARRLWLNTLAGVLLSGMLALGATLGWLKWHESDLVFETARSHTRRDGVLPAYAERIRIPEHGGTLAAVELRAAPGHDSGFWVLHLHGNADTAFSIAQLRHCEQLHAWGLNVLAFDYRGFGHTAGVASEAHLYQDADAAYAYLVGEGIPARRIILWGHSLGTAPAVLLASRHPAAALVLFGAFTSISDAAAATYPYLPVRWLVSIRMDSLQQIGRVHLPVIIAHSVSDAIIPFAEGRRLYAAANPPKYFVALPATDDDGMGGHVDALYDQLGRLMPQLAAFTGAHLWR